MPQRHTEVEATEHIYEYLIIGAGPAGLQLGHLLHAGSRDYPVLEAGAAPGTFFTVFPRHRQLISISKPHTGETDPEPNMRMDWNSLLCPNPKRGFKKSTTGFIHGFRYTVRALHHIFGQRHHAVAWPYREVPGTAQDLAEAVLRRVERSSALWQQFAVMADLLVVPGSGGPGRYYEEVPVAYALDGGLGDAGSGSLDPLGEFLTVTREFGPDQGTVDPFDITVPRFARDQAGQAVVPTHFHPVIRPYRGGRPVAVHHIVENQDNEWGSPPVRRAPVIEFFTQVLAGSGAV